jgi:hypothetical protein
LRAVAVALRWRCKSDRKGPPTEAASLIVDAGWPRITLMLIRPTALRLYVIRDKPDEITP